MIIIFGMFKFQQDNSDPTAWPTPMIILGEQFQL